MGNPEHSSLNCQALVIKHVEMLPAIFFGLVNLLEQEKIDNKVLHKI